MQAAGCWARQVSGLGKSRQVPKKGTSDMQDTGCLARDVSGLCKCRQVQKGAILTCKLLAAGLGKSLG